MGGQGRAATAWWHMRCLATGSLLESLAWLIPTSHGHTEALGAPGPALPLSAGPTRSWDGQDVGTNVYDFFYFKIKGNMNDEFSFFPFFLKLQST